MSQTILEMAKDLVMAQIQAGAFPVDALHTELLKTYAVLAELRDKEEMAEAGMPMARSAGEESSAEGDTTLIPSHWKKSIKKHHIECLVCGAAFKQLSVRHLKEHGLDATSYRVRFGIPRTQPLSAKETTSMRKQMAQQSRPWEKAPTYLKAQSRKTADEPPPRAPGKAKRAVTTL